jgi:hypothetical protein
LEKDEAYCRLSLLCRVVLVTDVFDVYGGIGVFHVQRFQVLDYDTGNGKVSEPLMVGWDDEPRRLLSTAPG